VYDYIANAVTLYNQAQATATGNASSTGRTNSEYGSKTLTSASTSSLQSKQLPAGAKAGIGVGSALLGLFFVSMGVWLFQRRKGKSKDQSEPVDKSWTKAELHAEPMKREDNANEVEATVVHELDHIGIPGELASNRYRPSDSGTAGHQEQGRSLHEME
jgi:hypothetical protein